VKETEEKHSKPSAGILNSPLLPFSHPLPHPHNPVAKNVQPGAGRCGVQFLLVKMFLDIVLAITKSNFNPHLINYLASYSFLSPLPSNEIFSIGEKDSSPKSNNLDFCS